MLAAVPLCAQAPASPPPPVSVGGLFVTRYLYQLTDTANHLNAFDITRAYLNVIGRFPGGLYTRVTADVFTTADSSRAYRIKFAYVAYTPGKSPLTYKIGEIHTPWLDWEEALWDYRMQGPMAMDRAGYLSASDFGAGVDGKWGPDKVNMQVALVNGEGFNKGTGDRRKELMGRVSLRVRDTNDSSRIGGLRLTAYGQYGKPTSGGERRHLITMISYRSKQTTLAAEAAVTHDTATAPVKVPTNGHLYSAFGIYKIPHSKAAIIARLDVTHAQAGTTTDRQTRFIGGVSYQLHPNWRLLADWDYVGYQATPTAPQQATRSQALFQTMFTF
jgi:hypothetical protein